MTQNATTLSKVKDHCIHSNKQTMHCTQCCAMQFNGQEDGMHNNGLFLITDFEVHCTAMKIRTKFAMMQAYKWEKNYALCKKTSNSYNQVLLMVHYEEQPHCLIINGSESPDKAILKSQVPESPALKLS